MSVAGGSTTRAVRLFDAHCHLQDPRISAVRSSLIRTSLESGVVRFAVNGVSEKDWHVVKRMGEEYPSVIPCFGLHPWYVAERSPDWLRTLRETFLDTPTAAVGEIGLDKGSHGKTIDFGQQVEVFRLQLELAKELGRPVSVHCVRAFGDLLEILRETGPFPAGVLLHSYLGSAEMVPAFANLGSYFSFSGFISGLKEKKAKKMLNAVPIDRILVETDAPDALPTFSLNSLTTIPDSSLEQEGKCESSDANIDKMVVPKDALNHPANIHLVLSHVASLLEMQEEELADVTYQNATRLFSYPGSKILH